MLALEGAVVEKDVKVCSVFPKPANQSQTSELTTCQSWRCGQRGLGSSRLGSILAMHLGRKCPTVATPG